MPTSNKPKCGSISTRTGANIRSRSARPRPTAGESIVRTESSTSRSSSKTAGRNSTGSVSQAAEGSTSQPPKNASTEKLTAPTSRLQGSQVATAVLPKAPVDAESHTSLATLKSGTHHNTSRAPSAAVTPSRAELLPGFVAIDSWEAVQANTYVVLGHGPYQRRVLMCGMLSVTVVLFHYLAYKLVGKQVDHWCMTPDDLSFLSIATWKNTSIPIEADGNYSRCTMYDPPLQISQENRTAVPCHQWGYDIANKADSIVSRFDLVCDRKYLYDLSSLAPIIGSALVAPLLGLASDRAGRKPVMLMCAFVQLLATVACSFSQTYTFFVSTRILLFVAADVTFLNTFILIHEVTGNERRATFTILDTAVPLTVVPPLMHALSLLEPRWMLAQALTVLSGVMLAVWCWLQEESPAWLIATRHIGKAGKVVLLAAKENGVDVEKARTTFTVIMEQLSKLDEDTPNAAPIERVLEAVKTRRRAISALLTRFTLDATFIGVTIKDEATGISWEVANVFAFAAYVASICVFIRRYGVRESLSGLLVILSGFCILEALTIIAGEHTLTRFVQAGLKVAVSGALTVVCCYTAETFPTAVRNVGISLAHLAGGLGNVVAIAVILLTEPHAGHVFYALSAFMVLLSVAAIQWLPEVYVEKLPRAKSQSSLSAQERKAALVASLNAGIPSHKRRESRMNYGVAY
ncbi:solute carrier family 22 member 7 [Rhipicephalus microplus]|uniref:solute carrier family 22 member 7 n=1 Tax=Rhipicephalus microplus TaxID=6941 RepID=UPI003F6AB475